MGSPPPFFLDPSTTWSNPEVERSSLEVGSQNTACTTAATGPKDGRQDKTKGHLSNPTELEPPKRKLQGSEDDKSKPEHAYR